MVEAPLTQYPYERQLTYPGLHKQEIIIWEEYIRSHPDAFGYVYYNVHIGCPACDESQEASMRQSGAYEVSQWCIDVIGVRFDRFTIIEVKPNALAGAFGQLLAYEALLKDEYPSVTNTDLLVLTDSLSPITERASQLLGIPVITP